MNASVKYVANLQYAHQGEIATDKSPGALISEAPEAA